MISNTEFKAIAELDLDPIKVKLMHKESGEGWPLAYATAIEFEYRRFLHLMKMFPNEAAAPLFDVDIFWHYHILDTMKYAVDCESVFGYFLHHFPYVGLRDEEDEVAHQRAAIRMQELYEGTFDEPYVRPMTGDTGPLRAVVENAAAGAPASSAFSYAVAQEAVAAAAKPAFSYAVGQDAVTTGRKAAFSYPVGQDAVAAAVKAAFSYAVGREAGVTAGKTACSYAVGQRAAAAVGNTAFSYAVGQDAMAAARKAAFSYAVGQDAVAATHRPVALSASDAPVDLATLRRLYFERPVLIAA